MRIGVIGGGRVGSALAATWTDRGHEVVISTRDTVAETAAGRDVVVLALPASAAEEALAAARLAEGQVVVDATNNLSGGPSGTEIAAFAPSARFVKAFNTVFSTFMHDTPPNPAASLVYTGDDAGAKATVAQLVTDAGFEPVDAGGADATPLVEAFAAFMRVPRTSLAVPDRRAQYSGTGPESLVPRAASGRGGGRLRRPGAVAGPRLLARRDPLLRITPLCGKGCA